LCRADARAGEPLAENVPRLGVSGPILVAAGNYGKIINPGQE